MVTPRDRVWAVALALAESRRGFGADDVVDVARDTFDEDAPSRSTVHNTLAAMAEVGVLVRIGERGKAAHYVEA